MRNGKVVAPGLLALAVALVSLLSPTRTPAPTPSPTPPLSESLPCGEAGLAGRTDIVFCEGYEMADWKTPWTIHINSSISGSTPHYTRVTDPAQVLHGQASLKVTIPETADTYVTRTTMLPSPGYEALYYRWYQKVGYGDYFDNEVAIKGNGLYGWEAGQPFSQQRPFFSIRASAQSPHVNGLDLHVYAYTTSGNISYRPDVPTNYMPDEWTCVEVYLQVNTFNADGSPRSDGVMRLWKDAELIDTVSGVQHRASPGEVMKQIHNIDRFKSHTGIPGTLLKWEDNLVVARNRIGCSP